MFVEAGRTTVHRCETYHNLQLYRLTDPVRTRTVYICSLKP